MKIIDRSWKSRDIEAQSESGMKEKANASVVSPRSLRHLVLGGWCHQAEWRSNGAQTASERDGEAFSKTGAKC